jgi:hypothetical protein
MHAPANRAAHVLVFIRVRTQIIHTGNVHTVGTAKDVAVHVTAQSVQAYAALRVLEAHKLLLHKGRRSGVELGRCDAYTAGHWLVIALGAGKGFQACKFWSMNKAACMRYAVANKDYATFEGVHGTGTEETRPPNMEAIPIFVWHSTIDHVRLEESFEHSLKSG